MWELMLKEEYWLVVAEVWWNRYIVDNNMVVVEAAIEHVHILWHGELQHKVVEPMRRLDGFKRQNSYWSAENDTVAQQCLNQ